MCKCEPSDVLGSTGFMGYFLAQIFSQIWLELSTTNNDPNVILLSYLLAVLNNNGSKYMHG